MNCKRFLFSFLALTIVCSPILSQLSDSTLISHYPFDGNFKDSINSNFVEYSYGVDFMEDRHDKELSASVFSSTANYIVVQENLFFENKLSVSAWIKTDDTKDLMIISSKYNSDEDRGFQIAKNGDGFVRFAIRNGTNSYIYTESESNIVSDNEWHFIVGICDESNIQVWVDGKLESKSELDYKSPSILSTSSLRFSSLEQGSQFPYVGALDDFKLYNRVLTDDEILAEYEDGITSIVQNGDQVLSLFPNPAMVGGTINIAVDSRIDKVIVTSLKGERFQLNASVSNDFDISFLSSGMYFLTVEAGNKMYHKKLMLR